MLLQNLAQNSQLGEDVPLLGVKKLWATQDVWIEVVNCNHLWYLHCYHSSCLTVWLLTGSINGQITMSLPFICIAISFLSVSFIIHSFTAVCSLLFPWMKPTHLVIHLLIHVFTHSPIIHKFYIYVRSIKHSSLKYCTVLSRLLKNRVIHPSSSIYMSPRQSKQSFSLSPRLPPSSLSRWHRQPAQIHNLLFIWESLGSHLWGTGRHPSQIPTEKYSLIPDLKLCHQNNCNWF